MKTLLRYLFLMLGLLLISVSAGYALPKVLILHANPTDRALDVQKKLVASGKFATVDLYDMGPFGTTPTLANLTPYDAIITFTNYSPNAGVGAVVGQYIEQGGGVVNGVFSIINDTRGLYTDPTYEALVPGNAVSGTELTLGTIALPKHPIMAGVKSFDGGSGSFHSDATTFQPNAYLVASWSDGSPLVVAKENVGSKKAKIVDLNFFLPSDSTPTKSNYWHSGTDGALMMINALLWVVPPPPAQLSVSPKSMNFQSAKVGDSVVMCGSISSQGPGTLQFQNISISGSTDYTLQSGPKANDTLVSSGVTTFCVVFRPNVNGTRNATLTFTTNGRDSGTQSVVLTGVGTAPAISLPVTSLFRRSHARVGDTTSLCFPVISNGTGPLRIDSVVISGTNPSAYYVVSKPRSILNGTTDSICIGFTPNFEGRTDAIATVYSNAINLPVTSVSLGGNGTLGRLTLSPTTLRFDSVAIGQTVCKTVTLSNPGTDTVRILRNYTNSHDYDFTFTPLAPSDTVILPDHSVTMNICFQPLSRGTRIASYAFQTNIAKTFEAQSRDTSLFILNIVGTGVPVGRLAFGGASVDTAIIGQKVCTEDTIYNIGADDIQLTNSSLSGRDSASFAVSGLTLPVTIKAGGFIVVNVCTTPQQRGINTTSLVLSGMASGKQQSVTLPVFTVGLSVCAQAQPTGLFTKGITLIGTSDSETFTVTNCGDVATSYTVTVPPGSSYTIVPSSSAPIAPNGTATFTVIFTPTVVGVRAGSATVSGGTGITPMLLTFSGVGGGVNASATGQGGLIRIGECKNFDVTITNDGNVDWTPGTATIAGSNAGDFTVVSGPTPATIAPNGKAVLTVKFCPTVSGEESTTLTFASAKPQTITPFAYTLTGTGTTLGVKEIVQQNGFSLEQNYPNPSNDVTEIGYTTPNESMVRLTLVDQKGDLVKTLVNNRVNTGVHSITMNTRDLASGTYFYILEAGDIRLMRQMVIVK